MGERALGWGLRLLGLFLMIGPFIIALGSHNWDIQAAVLPSEAELGQVQETLSGILGGGGFSENTLTIESSTFDGTTIMVTLRFNSPFKFPIKIADLSGYVSCGDHPGTRLSQVSMQEDSVEIPAEGTGTFTITGQPTSEGLQHIINSHQGNIPSRVDFENVIITFEFYGVSVRFQITTAPGGP